MSGAVRETRERKMSRRICWGERIASQDIKVRGKEGDRVKNALSRNKKGRSRNCCFSAAVRVAEGSPRCQEGNVLANSRARSREGNDMVWIFLFDASDVECDFFYHC